MKWDNIKTLYVKETDLIIVSTDEEQNKDNLCLLVSNLKWFEAWLHCHSILKYLKIYEQKGNDYTLIGFYHLKPRITEELNIKKRYDKVVAK